MGDCFKKWIHCTQHNDDSLICLVSANNNCTSFDIFIWKETKNTRQILLRRKRILCGNIAGRINKAKLCVIEWMLSQWGRIYLWPILPVFRTRRDRIATDWKSEFLLGFHKVLNFILNNSFLSLSLSLSLTHSLFVGVHFSPRYWTCLKINHKMGIDWQ